MASAHHRLLALSLALSVPLCAQAADDDPTPHWPSFRGADAQGTATTPLPLEWNAERGINIQWKTPIPGLAHSSPVIWGDRMFVTTAVREAEEAELSSLFGSPGYGSGDSVVDEGPHIFRVYCLDKRTGDVLWKRDAHVGVPKVKRHPKSTHANPSPACDAERVVVSFASEGLYCYDHEGTLLWTRDLGVLNSGAPGYPDKSGYQWGFASSPILHGDRVIIQCDVENDSFVAALDATTGADVWRTPRDEDSTWGTPTVYERDGARKTVVVNGYKHIGGYDLETGEEIWSLVGGGDVPVPTPVVGHDLIYITNAHGRLRPIYAIRTDASGELTMDADECEHMQWCHPRKGVYMQTPLVLGDYLYCCADNGVLGCYDARTGEEQYRERLGSGGTGFSGSPITDGRHLYFTGESGEIFIVKPGPDFERVGINEMGETCLSTPAASEGVLFVRTRGHVVAIGPRGAAPAPPPAIDPPAPPGAMAPRLAVDGDGLLLSWIERRSTDGPDRLRFARFDEGRWSTPVTITERADFFANWADLPSITRDPGGALLAHWLQKSGPDTYAYDVVLARSIDDGASWTTIGPAHRDGTQTEHGFVSSTPASDGTRIFWLDGREMKTDSHGQGTHGGHGHGTMTLRTALVSGTTVGSDVVLDPRVCECCNTDAAITDAGPIVVYRDRGAHEVRDVSIVRHVEGAWTAPAPVHADGWEIADCPVNGPACAARGSQLVVAWYTGVDHGTVVRVAFSMDAGRTFAAPIDLNTEWAAGRADVVCLDNGDAVVSWIEMDDEGGAILLRRVAPTGPVGRAIKVATASVARTTGFPQLAVHDESLIVVWTEDADPTSLRATRVGIAALNP